MPDSNLTLPQLYAFKDSLVATRELYDRRIEKVDEEILQKEREEL